MLSQQPAVVFIFLLVGFDPVEISTMLRNEEINAVSACSSLWRILLQNKNIFGSEAGDLKWNEIGSQFLHQEEKEALKSLFYKALLVNLWSYQGLLEVLSGNFTKKGVHPGNQGETCLAPWNKFSLANLF